MIFAALSLSLSLFLMAVGVLALQGSFNEHMAGESLCSQLSVLVFFAVINGFVFFNG